MISEPCSIFNEVLGPVMIGPSSSHTAGPARIGKVIHTLAQDDIIKIDVTFEEDGAYAATYKAQGSDNGFIGGLLGMDTTDENIRVAVGIAQKKGIEINFSTVPRNQEHHPNYSLIQVWCKNGESIRVESNSTGGGMFEIISVDGYSVMMMGCRWELLAFCQDKDKAYAVETLLKSLEPDADVAVSIGAQNKALVHGRTDYVITEATLSQIRSAAGVNQIKIVPPVLPVVKKKSPHPPFLVAKEALEYGKELQLWELACDYEKAISGKSQQDIIEMMMEIADIMKDSAVKALSGKYGPRGFLPPQSIIIAENIKRSKERYIDLGLLNDAVLWGSAVMEYDICRGRVVAAPTGGSSGILPGAVVCLGEKLGHSKESIAKALLAAGLIGVFVSHQASFAGEVCGCQAENGAGSAMAAAGVVQLLGGTADEGFRAAALSLQNMLGLICDPVAGVGNIPCVSRNSLSVANAVISANMVLNGFDPYIPLDETIDAMWNVGQMMHPDLLCTGRGGLCATPTGKRVLKELGY